MSLIFSAIRSRRAGTRHFRNYVIIPLLWAVQCALSPRGNAVVIVNDAVIVQSSFNSADKRLALTQSIPDGQGLFAIEIATFTSSLFNFSYFGIAEEYGLFLVTVGTVFDPAYAIANDPIVSNNGIDPGSSAQQFTLNQSKYFGYWDDRLNGNVPDSTDNYGWVRITRTASGLVASSGATAIGGGIIVGTTTQVPEPASAVLLLGGSVLLALRRWRR